MRRTLHRLKGLSYEIDFENVENLQILALKRAAACF
jgi:hypothetical protein